MKITVKHIAKSFGDKEVLKDVSFSLEKGEVKVLMGTNGSGKTTLFNIISGYLKPDKGNVLLNDKNILKKEPHLLNQMGISRTFQDMRLIGELSVLENIMLSFVNQSGEEWWNVLFPNRKVRQEEEINRIRAIEILNKCFIEGVKDSKANEISYGQQKLLNLACCIANDAEIILLDELVAGVNPVYREQLEIVIKNLKKEKAILIIEHNADFIEAIADEILFLSMGKVTKFNDYESLRFDETVKEAYI